MKTRDELIQGHIERSLSAEDKTAFETLWETDGAFREDVRLQSEIHQAIAGRLAREGGASALRNSLRQAEDRFRRTAGNGGQPAKNRVFALSEWKKWAVSVAAAACLLVLGRLFFFAPAEYYELPRMRSEVVRGDADGTAAVYEDAVRAFNGKDYASATAILRQLASQEPDIVQYRYYLGLSLLGERKFQEAAEQLLPLADGESIFRQEANYHLAIAYSELDRPEDAKSRLERIDRKSKVYEKARTLKIRK